MDRISALPELVAITRQRFRAFRHLASTRKGDLLMVGDMGPDRVHHLFWGTSTGESDPVAEYYSILDDEVGRTLQAVQPNRVMVVSDHGAQAIRGGFCIQDWLIQQGYLVLRRPLSSSRPFHESLVDWTRTPGLGMGRALRADLRESRRTRAPGRRERSRIH